jgi:hypothetical protein
MKTFLAKIAGLTLMLIALPSAATVLSLNPSASSVNRGATLEVAVAVSGLGNGVAPSIGVFDLDIAYDASILRLAGVSFGDPGLLDQLDTGSGSLYIDAPGAGAINLYGLSLEPDPAALDAYQASDFTLVILAFDTLAAGSTSLTILVNALGDANGDALAATIAGATVTVHSNVQVPEPSIKLLLGAGALAMLGFTRRHKTVAA